MVKFGDGISSRAASGKQGYGWNGCNYLHADSFIVLPPYRIIGQMCILRQTLTINFSQKNIRYLT
jgi:hypothetical protein